MPLQTKKLAGLTFGMVCLAGAREEDAAQSLADSLAAHGAKLHCLHPDRRFSDADSPTQTHPQNSQARSELSELSEFTGQLLTGMIDGVIFRTSAGVARFLKVAGRQHDQRRVVDSLQDSDVIAASTGAENSLLQVLPKLALSISPDAGHSAWREILMAIDRHYLPEVHSGNPLVNLKIGLEQSADWFSLSSGLEARGATVVRMDVFPQSPPVQKVATSGFFELLETLDIQVLLFQNPAQAVRFGFLAKHFSRARLTNSLLDHHIVIAVGEATQEILVDRGFPSNLPSLKKRRSKVKSTNLPRPFPNFNHENRTAL